MISKSASNWTWHAVLVTLEPCLMSSRCAWVILQPHLMSLCLSHSRATSYHQWLCLGHTRVISYHQSFCMGHATAKSCYLSFLKMSCPAKDLVRVPSKFQHYAGTSFLHTQVLRKKCSQLVYSCSGLYLLNSQSTYISHRLSLSEFVSWKFIIF
jgi:hypothetical protein